MPLVGAGLSLAPEVIDGIEELRAFRAHWITYSFSISKQRAELSQVGRRRHDGPGPFLTPRPTTSSSSTHSPDKDQKKNALTGLVAEFKNPVGRPKPKYSSIPGFDRPPGSPISQSGRRTGPASPEGGSGMPGEEEEKECNISVKVLPVSTRYHLAQFLDAESLLILSMASTCWFELGVSEVLWQLLACRLDTAGGVHGIPAMRNQRIALRDVGFADGRSWASACLFGESWKELVHSLPEDHGLFIIADFLNAPGIGSHCLARQSNLETARSPFPPQRPEADRPILLLFWDPTASPLVYRRAQFEHLQKIDDSRRMCFPDVTHILHCRTKGDLSLQRLANWLALGFGVRGGPFSTASGWDVTAVDTIGLPGMESRTTEEAGAGV